ncbi:hypothetical protein ACRRTK_009560 [Alexandromys fortis]
MKQEWSRTVHFKPLPLGVVQSGLHVRESLPSIDPSPGTARTTPTDCFGCHPEKEHVVSVFCVVSPSLSLAMLSRATRERCIKRGWASFIRSNLV